jgi:hypothetical protein
MVVRDKWNLVGFQVLTAVITKMAVFWVVAPCSLVEVYQRFRGPWDRPDDGSSKWNLEFDSLFSIPVGSLWTKFSGCHTPCLFFFLSIDIASKVEYCFSRRICTWHTEKQTNVKIVLKYFSFTFRFYKYASMNILFKQFYLFKIILILVGACFIQHRLL